MNIIFLGTPEFSVPSLQAIITAGFNIVAVVTAPDKPAGRGMKMQSSAVKLFATAHQIPVLQPTKLKDPKFIETLKSYKADVQVVIAFRMLPEAVWNMPPKGTINLHASLLPDYRGAAPINWAIINGETKTGVSTFLLKHEIDTGDLIMTEQVAITSQMNAGELHDLLKNIGARIIVETLKKIETGNYIAIPQPFNSEKIAPKIFAEYCKIDWQQPAKVICNKIKGLAPYPGATTIFDEKMLKVFKADYILENSNIEAGKMITDDKTFIKFKCKDGFVNILEIQLEGKKRMFVDIFLRGFKTLN